MTKRPLKPGSAIGILGSGQLGRMLAIAASSLGFRCQVFCPTTGPAFDICVGGMTAKYEDKAALAEFAKSVDVITYEFENIPVETVEYLSQFCTVYPKPNALKVSQDRLIEKNFLLDCGVDVARFYDVTSIENLNKGLYDFSGNGVLKTRRFGYDGKGQIMLLEKEPISPVEAMNELGNVPLILEELVAFEKEVSIIAIRGVNGDVFAFDIAENVHQNHILKTSTVPADIDDALNVKAKEIAHNIITRLDYVGAMGIEFFVVTKHGKQNLVVNEIAPRVHNSGHWTMDAATHSQFEQHIRAICGWPLANARRHSNVVMENLLGTDINDWQFYASQEDVHFHDYAKNDARPGRKMGHINKLSKWA